MEKIIEEKTVENMMALSLQFAAKTKLMSFEVNKAVAEANKHGMASMAMLGNSVFAIGDTKKLVEVLKPYGEIIVCGVDEQGVRMI